jgi:hypothetical protein
MRKRVSHADGSAWPVQFGDIWHAGPHVLVCGDLEAGHGEKVAHLVDLVDLTYCDPPWSAAIATGFRTSAGDPRKVDFKALLSNLLHLVGNVTNGDVWMEMGLPFSAKFEELAREAGAELTYQANITYYGERPCKLYGLAWDRDRLPIPPMGLDGLDDEDTPAHIIQTRTAPGDVVFDPCLGLGATLRGAEEHGRRCLGMELNPKRLAAALSRVEHLNPHKVGSLL